MTNVVIKAVEKKAPRKTVTVRVSVELHAKLKALTKFKNVTIQSVVENMVTDYVNENYTVDMEDLESE